LNSDADDGRPPTKAKIAAVKAKEKAGKAKATAKAKAAPAKRTTVKA
jgi:hypothetical protein